MMPEHTAADGMTAMMLLSLHASDYLRALLAKRSRDGLSYPGNGKSFHRRAFPLPATSRALPSFYSIE